MSSRKSKKDWLKELQKRRQRRFKSLRDKLDDRLLARSRIVIEPAGMEKMSDVLEDFVEPYLDSVEGEDGYHKLLSVAVLAWNAALLPDDEQQAMIDDVISHAMPPGPDDLRTELRSIVQSMVERKLAHFASNRRAIVSFDLQDTGRGYHLSVASTLGDAPG